jgi:ketosteroid isomerase-like protein
MKTNKDILIQANACVTAGDYEGFLAFCTEDTEWVFVGDQTLKGKQAVRDYMREAYVEPPQFNVEILIEGENYLTAIGKISIKGENGNLIKYDYCDVWRLLDGKLAQLKAFVIEETDHNL